MPDALRLPSRHFAAGPWSFMVHGFGFGQYISQGGPRGDSQLGSLNWAMLMASRTVAGGRFQARTMLSFDAATVTERGYPLLLQTGETFDGQHVHDRQHPHDFWMELALMYERPLSRNVGVLLYGGPSGEPAIGPVAFMHRPSAMDVPIAPLGHHSQDATHTSFGVVTAGLFGPRWKLEGSVFNGREPDQHRWNFEAIRLDSWAGRLTVNPSPAWSVSAGYGFLETPEAHHPGVSAQRIFGSVMWGREIGEAGQIAATFLYGGNRHDASEDEPWLHSVLAEAEAVLDRRLTIMGRLELLQKSAEDFEIPGLDPERKLSLATVSVGGIAELGRGLGATLGAGVQGTVNVVPRDLKPHYGSRFPLGMMVFLRVRPELKPRMDSMGMD